MKTRLSLFAALAAATALSLLVVNTAHAQAAVATLTGRVTDPQDAGTPGATITLRNTATAAAWTVASDSDGRFTIPMLPPGTYAAEVTLSGFTPWRADEITLQVGQTRDLDVRLSVSSVQEAVVVREPGRTTSTAVDAVLNAKTIEALPLNGRNFLELALLVPGNDPTPVFDPTKTNSVLISSAGQMGRGGSVTIDGQDNDDDVVGGPLLNLPIDAVQEFQIATNRFDATQGRTASSAINVVTRSGSNVMQGAASMYLRDGAWQALPTTIDTTAGAPPFNRQQWSGAFGGPVQKDRLFWFAAGEYRNQNGAVLVGTRNTATRTITRSFAPAPLDDGLWSMRVDTAGRTNRFTVRYAGEDGQDTAASSIERAIGSASQRQTGLNRYHAVLGTWTSAPSSTFVNAFNASVSTFLNDTEPVGTGPQLTFPSIQDGSSFRVPQKTHQTRVQVSDNASLVRGAHTLTVGGNVERIGAEFDLGVFQQGRVEYVEDFPTFDHNGDGKIDDNDLLFAVTLRSGKPGQTLVIPGANNVHLAGFAQDDWSAAKDLQLNLGLRYEIDTDVNNQSRVAELNPIVAPFVHGARHRDANNFGPRAGFAWNVNDTGFVVRGGYGIYYDRVVLEIQSLERGLDGRALPIEVRAGNLLFMNPATGQFPPFAPTSANPFTGFVLPGAGASGINIIDPNLQSPMVQEFHLGIERQVAGARVRVDGVHDAGRDFLIGRTVGQVFNPVVGGPDRVVNLESSAKTKYDALMVTVDHTLPRGGNVHAAYTLSKAFNYANDDQIPFLNGPIDPDNLPREFGPTPNDRRHRFVASAQTGVGGGVMLAGLWTISSGVPMDIMMPDGQTRVPTLPRNAGGRLFTTAAELNSYLTTLNGSGGVNGVLLPLVSSDAQFNDTFNSLDLRVSRPFALGQSRVHVEPMIEVFNLFNVTNILGISNVNYSGFSNVLVRDSQDPANAGYLKSSAFGKPVSTAGGVFGSGGPRAMQIAARVTF